MGCASSTGGDPLESKRDRDIQKAQQNEERHRDDQIKLLLLGAGESGKSTIFKQMKILYGEGWDQEELTTLRGIVFTNVIQNMRPVLQYIQSKPDLEIGSPAGEEIAPGCIALTDDADFTPEVAGWMKLLWATAGVQQAWKERSNYQVLDCLEYYCKDMDRIAAKEYIPTEQDVLQARVRTTGIVEEKYTIDGVQFIMFDVGGQRNERKKWMHAFENVTAMIFVAAISEYDQVLYEDSTTNRIDEAVKLFDEVSNSQWFAKTSIILFLNKNDLFREKLPLVPLRVEGGRYDDFKGPYVETPGAVFTECLEAAHEYFIELFASKVRDKRQVYAHVTEATDTQQINVVLNACKDIILRSNLQNSGFMDT